MKVTVTIEDRGDELTMEGRIDNPEALDGPPTAALIVGSYLSAHADRICKDAMTWFMAQNKPQTAEPGDQLQLVDIHGHPV